MLGFEKLFNKSQKENEKEVEHDTSIEDNQHEFDKVMEEKEEGTPEDIINKEKE